MQTIETNYTRPPSRLAHNKQNIHSHNIQQTKRQLSIQTQTKHKHNYDIYFPKESSIKKKPFLDQPQNHQPMNWSSIITKPKKSLSSIQPSTCAKTLVQSVKKRLTTKEVQRYEELQKKRKNSIGAVAYIPTTLQELKVVVKRR